MADLSEDDKVATLASVTGEEDLAYCRRLLEAHGFDLEAAVNTAIGEGFRDGDRAADGARMMGDASHATTATGYSGPGSRPPTDSAHRRVLQGGAGVAPINPLLALPITVVNRSLGIVFTVIGFGFKVAGSILHRLLPPGMARRVRTLPHAVGGQTDDPISSAVDFKHAFRGEYGVQMPDFVEVSHREALRMAQSQLKLLFVYLHSPQHSDSAGFCRDVLTHPEVLRTLGENFVCWGGDVHKTDAYQLAERVSASTFPYVAVLSSMQDRWSLLMACEGAVGVEHLQALLVQVAEEQSGVMTAARVVRNEQDESRRLREEQDAAYQASLEADAKREAEAAEREAAERAAAERAAAAAAAQAEAEAAAAAEEKKRLANIARRREEKAAMLLKEPPISSPGVCKVAVRLPDGSRQERRFLGENTVGDVYNFVDTLEGLGEKYSLVSNFPRRVFSRDKEGGVTLVAAGLHPQAMLMYQSDD